jgi:hypothetical protein
MRTAGYQFSVRSFWFIVTDNLPGEGGDAIQFINLAPDVIELEPGVFFAGDDSAINFFHPSGTALKDRGDIDLTLFPKNGFSIGTGFLGEIFGSNSGDFSIGIVDARLHRVGPPPNGVPDAGSTLGLLAMALGGLGFIRRRAA